MERKVNNILINEVAQNIQMGDLEVYLHKKSLEIITILPEEIMDEMEDEMEDETWKEDFNKVNENPSDYIHFSKMNTREAFQIMEDFVEEVVSDKNMENIILHALSQSKPFRRFKDIVEVSNYREKWFAFQQSRYEDYVRAIIEEEID